MSAMVRLLITCGVTLVMGAWFLAAANRGTAADDKEVADDILKLTETIKNKDEAGAKTQAEEIGKKYELEDVMHLLKLRKSKGFGIGDKKGAYKENEDGIEAKIIGLGNKALTAKDLGTQSKDLVDAAYRTAAIAEVALGKCPVDKKQGEKDPKKWRSWTEEMRKSAVELASAAQAKNAKSIKTVASKLNSTCNDCHAVFRD
jgi:hypothetical protein